MRLPCVCLAFSLLFTSACDEAKSERCREVCRQEADCSEQAYIGGETIPYSVDECVAACVALERDKTNRGKVDRHVECAKRAGQDCEKLLQCRF